MRRALIIPAERFIMRLHKLARSLDVPPSAMLDALRQAGLGARFGSPMTHVLDDDLPEIFRACEQYIPELVLSPEQLELAHGFAEEVVHVKARARDATIEAHIPQAIPKPVHPPFDVSWSTFLDQIGEIAGGGSLRTSTRLGYDSGEGEVRLLAESVASRRVMARRRLAVDTLYSAYGAFDHTVILDLFLFEVSESLQGDLHAGDSSLILALQGHLKHMFPVSVDEDELTQGLAGNSPEITTGLSVDDVALRLRFDFNVAEQVGKYSNIDAFGTEEFQEMEQMIRGEVPMNYRRLKKIYEDERLTMQSALPHELLRSDEALVEMARTHLGDGAEFTLIDLFGSNENSRYEFFIVASAQHAIGYVTIREL